jgi:Uma2 family endonuclease
MERASSEKHEFAFGEIFAMTGASVTHGRIVTNLVRVLGNKLLERPCDVFTSDLRLCVDPKNRYTYPDIIVICGKPQFLDNQFDTLVNPDLIVEVLSDSTRNYDRGEKFQQYRSIPSFREYLVVEQAKIHVERYSKQPDGTWSLWETDLLDGVVELSSIGVAIQVSDIYRRTDLSTSVA